MTKHDSAAQGESRSERVAVAVTPSQKQALIGLAAIQGTDTSNLLHRMSVEAAVTEFERIKAAA